MKITQDYQTRLTAIASLSVALMLVASPQSQAAIVGFQGPYAPANWTFAANGGDGSVDTTGAPSSIALTGNNTVSPSIFTDFTINAVDSGQVSFTWAYFSFDIDPRFDDFGYLLNGVYTFLSRTSGDTGSTSFAVVAGDSFGFSVYSEDGQFGPGVATITSFEVAAIPEPGTWAAATLLVAGAALVRRRRRKIS